jgi:raffinose/stachyose/melibiose transport system permease protein
VTDGAATVRVGRAERDVARAARRRRPGRRQRLELTLLLGPGLVLFVGFVLVPIVVAAYYSLNSWDGFGPLRWVGVRNYSKALSDPVFQHAVLHNLIIVALSLLIQLPLSLAVAMLLDRRLRGGTFLRLVVFAPYVLSEAITAVVWLQILQPGGLVDEVLKTIGLGGLVHEWLADGGIVLYTLFVVITWKYIGFGIILLLAGLQGIPYELREAANLDGATAWDAARHVVLPLLGPTIRIWIFLSVIGALQLFEPRVDHDPRGPGRGVDDDGELPHRPRLPALRVRLRQRGGRRPVRDLLRVRADLSALRAAA